MEISSPETRVAKLLTACLDLLDESEESSRIMIAAGKVYDALLPDKGKPEVC